MKGLIQSFTSATVFKNNYCTRLIHFRQTNITKGPRIAGICADVWNCWINALNRCLSDCHHNVHMSVFNPIQTGLFASFWDKGGGRLRKPPYVTLKPLMLWTPSLHRIVYALILNTIDTVMSLWRDMTSLWHLLLLNVSLRSSEAINLLTRVSKRS